MFWVRALLLIRFLIALLCEKRGGGERSVLFLIFLLVLILSLNAYVTSCPNLTIIPTQSHKLQKNITFRISIYELSNLGYKYPAHDIVKRN